MAKQSAGQRQTVARVMHEWKHGELKSGRGGKVRGRRQAIAVALSEAGASNQQSSRENRRQFTRTKTKERRGETAQQRKEGQAAIGAKSRPKRGRRLSGPTRAQLYRKATQRKIPGRSGMNKAQLARALKR